MLAPSPDWFTGITNVNLYEDNRWVKERTIEAYAYDAGTDDGIEYTSKNKETKPHNKVIRIEKEPFLHDKKLVPIGTFNFIKIE